jgi:hypothetical protein
LYAALKLNAVAYGKLRTGSCELPPAYAGQIIRMAERPVYRKKYVAYFTPEGGCAKPRLFADCSAEGYAVFAGFVAQHYFKSI